MENVDAVGMDRGSVAAESGHYEVLTHIGKILKVWLFFYTGCLQNETRYQC